MEFQYTTERLILRDFIPEEDAPILQGYLSDKELAWQSIAMPHPLPEGTALQYINNYQRFRKEGVSTWFAVTLKENNQFIGITGLIHYTEHKKAHVGYSLGRQYWGKGYATEAAKKMLEVGFKDLGLNRIGGTVYADNENSLKVMSRLGLKREGTWRSDFIKWGEVRDVAFFGLLKEEYEEMMAKEKEKEELLVKEKEEQK